MHVPLSTLALLAALLLPNATRAQEAPTFAMTLVGPNNFLDTPWDLHYGPDDHLWVTERTAGVILRVDPATGARDELIRIAEDWTH